MPVETEGRYVTVRSSDPDQSPHVLAQYRGDDEDRRLLVDDRGRVEALYLERQDAIDFARAILRTEVGPSAEDVREAWGAECVDVVHASDGKRCVSVYCGGWPMSFTGDAEAEVLQAAYDAAPPKEVGNG